MLNQNLSELERAKLRLDSLKKTEQFAMDSSQLHIVPNFKHMDYKKHKRKGDAQIEQTNQYLLCCRKTVKLDFTISLDLINLRNEDTSLNFVMNFDKQVIDNYMYLDVVIYSQLKYDDESQENSQVSENVCLLESFDLDRGLPPDVRNSKSRIVECV